MTFGEDWGWGASKERAAIFRCVADAGVTSSTREPVHRGTSGSSWANLKAGAGDSSPRRIHANMTPTTRTAAEPPEEPVRRSTPAKRLTRLHRPLLGPCLGRMTPRETMRALDDVRTGRSSTSGSPTPRPGLCRGRTRSRTERLEFLRRLQIQYNLADRTRNATAAMAKALDLAVTPWGSRGGVLTGIQVPERSTQSAIYEGRAGQSVVRRKRADRGGVTQWD